MTPHGKDTRWNRVLQRCCNGQRRGKAQDPTEGLMASGMLFFEIQIRQYHRSSHKGELVQNETKSFWLGYSLRYTTTLHIVSKPKAKFHTTIETASGASTIIGNRRTFKFQLTRYLRKHDHAATTSADMITNWNSSKCMTTDAGTLSAWTVFSWRLQISVRVNYMQLECWRLKKQNVERYARKRALSPLNFS